jgi:hypothetical protein
MQVCFLDYVRFLVGGMWGACTPDSFSAKAHDWNQGMHKRDQMHQLHMIRKATLLIEKYDAMLRN